MYEALLPPGNTSLNGSQVQDMDLPACWQDLGDHRGTSFFCLFHSPTKPLPRPLPHVPGTGLSSHSVVNVDDFFFFRLQNSLAECLWLWTARMPMLALGLSFLAGDLEHVTQNLSEPPFPDCKIEIKLL